ncbi:MAG: 3-deoxy-D-manno-octulosonate 8-phosphate phosphatase (KDO 8-P phosphatase) [Gammaproteobacteria bacterium]|nr:MAG: 3-deoxy-D-manno-octulosonate 8-phosphate phosphatase (KDO 8-P phosphatase) [Gammaproteobacteria bacterium]TND02938.1 MAG: 3-deoxy-D-manno-octulosonate 8-phosphate phosphatase (KDO 8-P phosphatase) [Gammaproteobacteria bacterium]
MQTIPEEVRKRAARIKMVVFDVDGVLTDGSLLYGDDGLEYKAFNSRDGHGMKMLMASGVGIAIITGRSSPTVMYRMTGLGITDVYQGQQDKRPAFEKLLKKHALRGEQAAYVGDDIVDLPVMLQCGLAVATGDAHRLVQQHAHWSTPGAGGRGAARDVCEMIMTAQGTLQAQFDKYLGG